MECVVVMECVEDYRADESVSEAQYAAPDNASHSESLEPGEGEFEREKMELENVGAVGIDQRPNKTQGVQEN